MVLWPHSRLLQQLLLVVSLVSLCTAGDKPLFKNCEHKDVYCFGTSVSPNAVTYYSTANPPATVTTGFRLEAPISGTDWMLYLAIDDSVKKDSCNFQLGNLTFSLASPVSSIPTVFVGDHSEPGDKYMSFFLKAQRSSNDDLVDAIQLYKNGKTPTITLTCELNGNQVEHKATTVNANKAFFNFYETVCKRNVAAVPAPKSAFAKLPGGEDYAYTCPDVPRFNEIFFGDTGKGIQTVYCSVKGWRNDNGDVIENDRKNKEPLCSKKLEKLELFPCGATDVCYQFDSEVSPTKLTPIAAAGVTNNNGFRIQFLDVDRWHLTISWPATTFAECKFKLGELEEIDCDTATPITTSGLKISSDKIGRDGNSNQARYTIISENQEEPVSDVLKVYYMKVILTLINGPTKLEPSEGIPFKCAASTIPEKPGETALDPTIDNAKYTCTEPKRPFIFLNKDNMNKNAIFCSTRGWRDENHVYIPNHDGQGAFCFRDPNPLKIFEDCDKDTKECYGQNEAMTALDEHIKATVPPDAEKPKLGVEFDKGEANKWIVTLAWEGDETCTFSIGAALTFDCGVTAATPQPVGAVTVARLDEGAGKKDLSVKYVKYSIESTTVPEDPIEDALKLYVDGKYKLILKTSNSPSPVETEEIEFVKACVQDPFDQPGKTATVATEETRNKYTCSGRNNQVFLNDHNTLKDTVYCSMRGWRDSTFALITTPPFTKQKVLCYTDDPPQPLPIFEEKCDQKECHTATDDASTLLVKTDQPAPYSTLGIELEMTSKNVWTVTMAWKGFGGDCKLFIGPFSFDCDQKVGDKPTPTNPAGNTVVVEKVDKGKDLLVIYEKYTITSSDESIVDAMRLYELPAYKIILKGAAKSLETKEIVFFKVCTPDTASTVPISVKAAKAEQTVNKFVCGKNPLLNYIYFNERRIVEGSVYCSDKGWRDGAHQFIESNGNQEPYCYSKADKTEMMNEMFLKCGGDKSCFVFDNEIDMKPTKLEKWSTPVQYNLGLDLDHSKDDSWTLIISYEGVDEMSFQVADLIFAVKDMPNLGDQPAKAKVIVKYEAKGQDGTAFFHKFTLRPENDGESMIDNLKLYVKKEHLVTLSFKGEHPIPSPGIVFHPESCDNGYHLFIGGNAKPPKTQTDSPNTFDCVNYPPDGSVASDGHTITPYPSSWKYIFIKNKFIGGSLVYCAKKGWRGEDHIFIQSFEVKEPNPFCFTLCSKSYLTIKPAHNGATKVEPISPSSESPINYQCLLGKASIMLNDKFYDTVTCADNKWNADNEPITMVYKEVEKDKVYETLTVECFGAFKFLKGNCDDAENKKEGCELPTITGDDTVGCSNGFALIYEKKIYKALKFVKGVWKDESGNEIGAAVESTKPECLSRCRSANVDLSKIDEDKLITPADYQWKAADNTGALKCSVATDILITNAKDPEDKYFNTEWKCDAKDKWTSSANIAGKDFASITTQSDLKVTAHCYQACHESKVVNGCAEGDEECAPPKYEENKLSCEENRVMLVDGEEMPKPLECTALGWKEDGGTAVLPKYDHTANKEVKLSVQCVDKCGKKFREGDDKTNVKYSYAGNTMACAGTQMISYEVKGPTARTATTLEDLTCVSSRGWNGGGNNLLIDFTRDGHHFAAKCVPSCTDDRIVDDCNSQPYCEKPTLKSESDLITCAEGTVLRFKKPNSEITLEYNSIQCRKKSFENVPKSKDRKIEVPRADPDTKIAIACYSKCDKDFVTKDLSTTNVLAKFEPSNTAKNYILECKEPLYYTSMKIDSKVQYTAEKFVCDPMLGWNAPDILKGSIFAEFEGEKHVDKATVGCLDICLNRYNKKCPDEDFTKRQCDHADPIYDGTTKTIKCENTQTMRLTDNKDKDFIRETLECTDIGYIRQSKPEEVIFGFKNTEENVNEKFEIYCHPNCRTDLVKPIEETTLIGSPKYVEDRDLAQYKSMDCTNGLLVIETSTDTVTTTRVFGKAMCDADKGWIGATAQTDFNLDPEATIVDFTKGIRLTAYCFKVCDSTMVKTDCSSTAAGEAEFCKKADHETSGNGATLKCDAHHRLFLQHGDVPDEKADGNGPATCNNQGWTADGVVKFNFKDPAVDITQTVKASCKHKCHRQFIEDTCTDADAAAQKCSNFKYEPSGTSSSVFEMKCNHPSEVLELAYEPIAGTVETKESFSGATCSDEGWKKKEGDGLMFAMDGTNYNIKAQCVQLCHPRTLNGDPSEIGTRSYELDGILTCTKPEEMLVFDGNEWYTDLTCSQKGWSSKKKDGSDEIRVAFVEHLTPPDPTTKRQFDAKCVPNACFRDFKWSAGQTDPCMKDGIENKDCRPDWTTTKYSMTCKAPMKIKRMSNGIVYTTLTCDKGNWYHETAAVIDKDENFDPVCSADECARCRNTLEMIKCDGDNCADIEFTQGSAFSCSSYSCPTKHSYKIGSNGRFTYYFSEESKSKIRCSKYYENGPSKDEYYTPDRMSTVGNAVGCVKQIPCMEHSPIKLSCDSLTVQCDVTALKEAITKSSYKSARPVVKCEAGKNLYEKIDDLTWKPLAQLQCNEKGQWDVTQDGAAEKDDAALQKNARVVCADKDPSIVVPPPPTTTAKPEFCTLCLAVLNDLKCKGCDNTNEKRTIKTDGDKCIVKSSTGRFGYNDGSSETTDDLTCQKDKKTGELQWKTKDGTVVKSFAIKAAKELDNVDMAMIGGVIGGCLLILLLISGAIVFFVIRRKRERQRLETLKSKGLEIKNDTILDQIDVDDPKTLML